MNKHKHRCGCFCHALSFKCLELTGARLTRNAICTAGAVLLVMLVLSSGCSKAPEADVLVKVGTRNITVRDFEQEAQWYARNQQTLPQRQALLDQLIDRELRVQKARALGLENDPDIRRLRDLALASKVEELELQPRLGKLEVEPTEIRTAYERELPHYSRPAKVHLAIVSIKTDRRMSQEQKTAAETRLVEARRAVLALPRGTRGFGSVAVDYSEDQASRYRGGDVGWFEQGLAEYRWPGEVVAAGFALTNNGDFSDVIKAADGFYLVSRLDWRPPSVTPIEQVQNGLRRRLLDQKRQETEIAFRHQLLQTVPIQIFTQALARVQYPATTLARSVEPPSLISGGATSPATFSEK